ncbi:MAG: bacillithiol system redox-active protein YtxJ [Planctomycetota bacterium]|nr:bacillithiol system redox-active protein YtxJ [Planctomycetota bacterium]
MKSLRIHDEQRLQAALKAERFLFFKHSSVCSISDHAFQAYERFLAQAEDLPTGWIEVREQRPLSNTIAEATGVEHQSPQALWVRDGVVVWHASHWDITLESLTAAVRR